jgi:predicted alpha-1,2-mannosidase
MINQKTEKMKLTLTAAIMCLIVFCSPLKAQIKEPVDYADPFIGTDFFGHTFPGASLPFAMVHLSPDVGTSGWTYSSGYAYSENSIIGFSHTHWSGTGMANGGEILLMPAVGDKLQVIPGTAEAPDDGYRSRFSHEDETASPGYYSVLLKDYNIKVELTATLRAGFHRYTFPASENARIILDLGHQIGDAKAEGDSEFRIINDSCIEGFRKSGNGKLFFVAEFSKPFRYYGTFDAGYITPESKGSIFPYKNGEKGTSIGAFVTFITSEGEQILVKTGISYTGIEGARKNLKREIPEWNFDQIRRNARDIWNKALSAIEIEGATEDQKVIFYTALYHSLLSQYIFQDVDGMYFGMDGKIHQAKGFDYYGSFSCWDTYRTQHPLLTLVTPGSVNDIIKSIEAKTRDYGWLPAQHFINVSGERMVGDHLIPIIADAYKKGFRDYDIHFLYEAMKKKALTDPIAPVPAHAGRPGLQYYIEKGYLPVDRVPESVSITMEMAYDDWCIAQIANQLGRKEDESLFLSRAASYKNLWDPETQFMRPRNNDGSWLESIEGRKQEIVKEGDHAYYRYFDPLLVGRRPNRHYTESNAWQYIWSVQHNPAGLIKLFGSRENFVSRLDEFFEMSPDITPPKYVGVVGTIGQYVHGNQPSHHVAYLYNYVGMPWKTQQRVRQITEILYRTGPGGLCGNEDMGSLSSWYIFSSVGFYPVSPGSSVYVLGSPLFGKATINTGKSGSFSVVALNNSENNIYIQSARLNGKTITRTWITHDEITTGGELVLEMGPSPSEKWGTNPEDAPPPGLP